MACSAETTPLLKNTLVINRNSSTAANKTMAGDYSYPVEIFAKTID